MYLVLVVEKSLGISCCSYIVFDFRRSKFPLKPKQRFFSIYHLLHLYRNPLNLTFYLNRYVHADLHGASSTVIKNHKPDCPVPPLTLNQTGCFTVRYLLICLSTFCSKMCKVSLLGMEVLCVLHCNAGLSQPGLGLKDSN